MQISTLKAATIGSWALVLVYDWIEKTTGMEPKVLLIAAVLLLTIGIYAGCRGNKGTTKEEA